MTVQLRELQFLEELQIIQLFGVGRTFYTLPSFSWMEVAQCNSIVGEIG